MHGSGIDTVEFADGAALRNSTEEREPDLIVHNIALDAAALAKFGEMPFIEFKLDRKFIADCSTDKVMLPLCRSVIDLAHRHRRSAVGMGIEKAADAAALISLGCDYSQGFLLVQPMPEERFIALLRQRSAVPPREPAAAR
ncbi:MAG: EAL domain-containing protein [Pseudolabrys sp.]